MAVKRSRGRNLNLVLAERKAERRARWRNVFTAAAIGIALLAIVHAVLKDAVNPPFEHNRLVVVPFENRTGDAAFDTLGVVASDWATRVLSGYARAREVVPTTTTLAYLYSARLARYDLQQRALELARGTRSQFVVWGTFYQTGDTLRFVYEIHDLKTSLMVGTAPPQIVVPVHDAMAGVDRLRNAIVRQISMTASWNRPQPRPVPNLPAYQAFVGGLDDMVNRRYQAAAARFAHAARRDTISFLPHQVWLLEALVRARDFARADSARKTLKSRRITTRADQARAMRALSQLRNDRVEMFNWSDLLAAQNRADDLAQYDAALDALALGRVREARRILGQLAPRTGALHGRPEVFLHHAAAYHLMRNHSLELRVVRAGLLTRHRSLDVRLANCRVRAALGDPEDAIAALRAIAAPDTDTTSALSVGEALEDCTAELDAHGVADAATRGNELAREWHARHPRRAAVARDSMYERPYIELAHARALAEQGDAGGALTSLYSALRNGLPYYEPRRMMLHAEPAFRRLRKTRGFLQMNQTRG